MARLIYFLLLLVFCLLTCRASSPADLILNPFGSCPRMVRGTIVKDSGKCFRPVVATFSGEGIGQDTVNLSYRERGFGL